MVDKSTSSLGISTTRMGCCDRTRGSSSFDMAQTFGDSGAAWGALGTAEEETMEDKEDKSGCYRAKRQEKRKTILCLKWSGATRPVNSGQSFTTPTGWSPNTADVSWKQENLGPVEGGIAQKRLPQGETTRAA